MPFGPGGALGLHRTSAQNLTSTLILLRISTRVRRPMTYNVSSRICWSYSGPAACSSRRQALTTKETELHGSFEHPTATTSVP